MLRRRRLVSCVGWGEMNDEDEEESKMMFAENSEKERKGEVR